jgi:hypothetical protein
VCMCGCMCVRFVHVASIAGTNPSPSPAPNHIYGKMNRSDSTPSHFSILLCVYFNFNFSIFGLCVCVLGSGEGHYDDLQLSKEPEVAGYVGSNLVSFISLSCILNQRSIFVLYNIICSASHQLC